MAFGRMGLGLHQRRRVVAGGGEVEIDEPSGSDGEADGLDQGTIIFDGGFSDEPTFGNQGNGKRAGGTTTDFAKFLFSIGVPQAGYTYTMTYDPDFSALSQQGKLAMVGFGFKEGNSYHFAGLKGDGTTGLNAHKAYGPNFNNLKATTEVDGGAAAHGTQSGPNWLQIAIGADGDTYTLRTSSDGTTWADEFTTDLPDPLSAATDATDFGVAIYLDAADKGAFTVDITLWSKTDAVADYTFTKAGTAASRPASMGTNDGPFWPCIVDMRANASFPKDWALYFSTDHASASDTGGVGADGGIWLFVADGDPRVPANWEDYDDSLANGDFDGVATKPAGNPIFQYDSGASWNQTESPHVVLSGGTYYLFAHNHDFGNNQSTFYATSSDGLNFTFGAIALDYPTSPVGLGDGHTGYARIFPNPGFTSTADTWCAYSYHGGGDSNRYHALWSSNDLETWTKVGVFAWAWGRYASAADNAQALQPLIDPNSIRELSDGRFAVLTTLISPYGGSGQPWCQIVEAILAADGLGFDDDDGFLVAIDLGGSGAADENSPFFPSSINYNGEQVVLYQGENASGVNSIMIATSPIPTLDPTLPALVPAIPSSLTTLTADATGLSALPANWSFNRGATNVSLSVSTDYFRFSHSTTAAVFSTITHDTPITLSDHDLVEIIAEGLGTNTLVDNPELYPWVGVFASRTVLNTNPRFVNGSANSFGGAGVGAHAARALDGVGGDTFDFLPYLWGVDATSQFADHSVGIRIWPTAGKAVALIEGIEASAVIDISGFDFSIPLYAGAAWNKAANSGTPTPRMQKITIRYG